VNEPGAIDPLPLLQGPGVRSAAQRELLRLMHELQVHEAELELQNEALRRTQEELEEAHERYFDLYELAPIGYATLDGEGRVVVANLMLSTLLGVDRRSLLGSKLVERVSSVDRGRFETFHAQALREAPKKLTSELSLRTRNGMTPVLLEGSASEKSDATLLLAFIDLTNLKRAEEVVSEREARLSAVFETVGDGIVTVGSDGRIESCNGAAARLFGTSSAWLVGQPVEQVIPGFTGRVGHARSELAVERVDGSVFPVEVTVNTLVSHEATRLVGVISDLSERKVREANELSLQAELRQAQRLEAIGTLASGIAHDFNNLLMGVGGCAQLALKKLDPEHEAYGYLRRAAGAILRGANLTRQILRFSDTRRSTDEPVELDGIVAGARDLIHSLVGEQIALSVFAGAPGLCIAADPGYIEQVLLNLASNARDAMPDGGALTLRTELEQGGMVALSVRDTGIGMSDETKRRVFEPFYTTKEVGKGTGLGLSTVFAVVRRMGGSIAVESAPGQGTTFTLNLPVVIPEPTSQPAPAAEATRGTGQTILIVDDDPLIRLTVETHVEALGYRALTAANVSDALRVYTENSQAIDVVLTDIMMPGLLGSDLGRILATRAPELAVIFMSAHPWNALVQQGHLTEDALLLSKPFDARDLGAVLHQVLEGKTPSKPPPALRVFVVDDDADVVDALRDLLEMEGHGVEAAKTARDALVRIPEFAPDIVLCDINFDETMSGLELVSRLHADERLAKTVFLAVTGMAPGQVKSAARAAGFADVLTKPLDFPRLSALLASHVEK
jgi:two-component system cell cycle sensor histidine kinase/response regulator CckA